MKARFKPKYNIRKGDNVVVITGDDKDLSKPRVVKQVLVEVGKVLIEGVNIITKKIIHFNMMQSWLLLPVKREMQNG